MFRLEVRNPVVVNSKGYDLKKIPLADIATLVSQLGLEEESAAQLKLRAWALTDWVVMPKFLMNGPEDRAASRVRLTRIAKKAAALKDELAGMGALAGMMMAQVGESLASDHDPKFNLMGLQSELDQLSHVAIETRGGLLPKKRGHAQDGMSGIVMRQLVRITELAMGEPIRASKTRNSVYDPHLKGTGGAFITAWFARVDPNIGPTELRRLVLQSKKELEQPGIADEDAKSLQLGELALLSKITPTR